MCDGLGACLGHCHTGALQIEKKEVAEYDEVLVVQGIIPKGKNTLVAHLKHLKDHGQKELLGQAMGYLVSVEGDLPFRVQDVKDAVHGSARTSPDFAHVGLQSHGGCPGSRPREFSAPVPTVSDSGGHSQLSQWPVQLHLINPGMPFFQGADLLVAADCVAFSVGNFHSVWLANKKLAIACPKLDANQEVYLDKFIQLINSAKVNSVTVMIMEVPCCGGLLALVQKAVRLAERKVPVKTVVVGVRGDIVSETWV